MTFYVILSAAVVGSVLGQQSTQTRTDKYTWLEEVESPRAMAWVASVNARSAAVLRKDERFEAFQAEAKTVLDDQRHIPYPELHGGQVYNFWQEATHPRGVLRVTGSTDYATSSPRWRTLLDIDALNSAEHASWVYKGMLVLEPENRLALIKLSAGGEDADTVREFDLKQGAFVAGGFTLSRSKGWEAWVDHDTLLVARDWGAGTMSTSDYPFVVKEWKRGTPLESAREIYRGKPDQNGTYPHVLRDAQGHMLQCIDDNLAFFKNVIYI